MIATLIARVLPSFSDEEGRDRIEILAVYLLLLVIYWCISLML